MRSVPAECADPSSTTSPRPLSMISTPAQDEGAHQDLAQLAVGLDDRAQAIPIDLDDFPAGRRTRARARLRRPERICSSPVNWPA